jgi:hypothetical protein
MAPKHTFEMKTNSPQREGATVHLQELLRKRAFGKRDTADWLDAWIRAGIARRYLPSDCWSAHLRVQQLAMSHQATVLEWCTLSFKRLQWVNGHFCTPEVCTPKPARSIIGAEKGLNSMRGVKG